MPLAYAVTRKVGNMYENVTREELAKLFLPKNQPKLEKLTLEELNEATKKILGCEVIRKHACMVKGNHSDMCCISSKYFEFFRVYQDYANIFDFCKTMGASHIYDIGQLLYQSVVSAVRLPRRRLYRHRRGRYPDGLPQRRR